MGGRSSNPSNTHNETNNLNSSIGLDGDNEGLVLSNVSGADITYTDHGATEAAFKLAKHVEESGRENLRETIRMIEHNTGQVFDVTSNSIDAVKDVSEAGFDFAERVQGNALNSIEDNNQRAFDLVADSQAQAFAFVNKSNQPDGGMTADIVKPIMYGSAAIVAALILSRVAK